MPNLTVITWKRCPGPSPEILQALTLNPSFTSLSVDCASGKWSGTGADVEDEYWDIAPFFSTIGPQILDLDLRHVSGDTYKVFSKNFHLLKSLIRLKLDIVRGVWDWDLAGSPQIGASANYKFTSMSWSESFREATLFTTDLAMSSITDGPLHMFDSTKLTKLVIDIQPCYAWIIIRCIRAFKALRDGSLFPNLEHLVIVDGIMSWEEHAKVLWKRSGGREMDPRYFINIHQFLATLPNLQRLWVNEWVLGVVKRSPNEDSWSGHKEQIFSASETWNTHEWRTLQPIMNRLESLRFGIGSVNDSTVEKILGSCGPNTLTRLGFEYDWNAYEPSDARLSGLKPSAVKAGRWLQPSPSLQRSCGIFLSSQN